MMYTVSLQELESCVWMCGGFMGGEKRAGERGEGLDVLVTF